MSAQEQVRLRLRYDESFVRYFFERIRQVFLYVTDRCGLRCEQCLYKTTLANRQFDFPTAASFIADFASLGAKKLTFIGGEPMLYDYQNRHRQLLRLISTAAASGYEYVRIDTNGQQAISHLLSSSDFRSAVSNLAFSVDGPDPATNDAVRGKGTFDKSLYWIRKSVAAGVYTTMTTCVHPGMRGRLAEMIGLARTLSIAEINFHPLFKMGIARDDFSGETAIEPREWLSMYDELTAIGNQVSDIHIRAPRRFVSSVDYHLSPEQYDYCPTRLGERVLLHPNGDIRICALCIGTPLRIGRWASGSVTYEGDTSEVSAERVERRPCMSQTKDFGDLIPLCISYKPGQHEYVWRQTRMDERLGIPSHVPFSLANP